MKRYVLLLLCLALLCSLASCKQPPVQPDSSTTPPPPTIEAFPPNSVVERQNDSYVYEIVTDEEGNSSVNIKKYIGTETKVVIPSYIDQFPVTHISKYPSEDYHSDPSLAPSAFGGTPIEEVIIPDTVLEIYHSAFYNCARLVSVTFGKNLEWIYSSAFRECSSLERVDLSDTKVLGISFSCFQDCTSLKEVILKEETIQIQWKAFYNCTSLEKIKLPRDLVDIFDEAFYNCKSIRELNIPKNLKGGNFMYVFNSTQLERVIVEEGREDLRFTCGPVSALPLEVIIPKSLKTFYLGAFATVQTLTLIFEGDCPSFGYGEQFSAAKTIIYYHPETEGWDDWKWGRVSNKEFIPIEQS